MLDQRRRQRIAVGAIGGAQAVALRREAAILAEGRDGVGGEVIDPAAAIEDATATDPLDRRGGGGQIAEAQAGRDRLGERAEADHGAGRGEAPEGGGRGGIVGQFAIGVVLHDRQPRRHRHVDQRSPPLGAQADAGGVVEGRDGVEEARRAPLAA